eukprot:4625523-Lingulodinium_polyedra.AAC.1
MSCVTLRPRAPPSARAYPPRDSSRPSRLLVLLSLPALVASLADIWWCVFKDGGDDDDGCSGLRVVL